MRNVFVLARGMPLNVIAAAAAEAAAVEEEAEEAECVRRLILAEDVLSLLTETSTPQAKLK